MSSNYGPVIVQNTRSSSSYTSTSRSSSNYSRGTYSSPMDSGRSSTSGSTAYSERYRDGGADNYFVDVSSRTNHRSGREVVVINQHRPSGSSRKKSDEPSSSDYGSSPSAGKRR